NVIQTVYKKTYDEYAEDDYIPITFQKDNPYNVFLPERGMFDWFYFTPNMIYIYFLLAFVLFITGSVLKGNIKEKRKRKKDKNRSTKKTKTQDKLPVRLRAGSTTQMIASATISLTRMTIWKNGTKHMD